MKKRKPIILYPAIRNMIGTKQKRRIKDPLHDPGFLIDIFFVQSIVNQRLCYFPLLFVPLQRFKIIFF
jgi:hypothetical protein